MADFWANDPVAGDNFWQSDPVASAPSVTADIAKSVGVAPLKGLAGGIGALGDVTEYGARGLDAATRYIGDKLGLNIPERPNQEPFGGSAQVQRGIESVTGPLYQSQTPAGKLVGAPVEMLSNPLSYVGPGSILLKAGGAALAGLGSEAAGQAAEGTQLETPARLVGGLAGGIAAGKALGPTAQKAAVPTIPELKKAEDFAYSAARNSGVEVSAPKLANWALQKEQQLTTGDKYAFTGGPDGTAPQTLKILEKLQNPPEGATVTASNLDTLRRQINDITGQTKDFKPTSDAKAASVLKREFASFLENPPSDLIVAGNAQDFVRNIKEGNATHSALQNTKTINQKITNAQDNTAGSIAARLDNQIKSQLRPILRNQKAQRGLTPEEVSAVRGVNSGTLASNVLSQVGRLGAGVIPTMAHVGTALATGGASIPAQIAIAAPLYAARKAGEQLTLNQARKLQDLMAMRSPLYQQRLSALPPVDVSPNVAAVVRGLLGGLR